MTVKLFGNFIILYVIYLPYYPVFVCLFVLKWGSSYIAQAGLELIVYRPLAGITGMYYNTPPHPGILLLGIYPREVKT